MGQCTLSDRQKTLLRALADGLRARGDDHRQIWVRMTHDTGMPVWQNIDDDTLVERLSELMKLGDFVTFEKCGFIDNAEPGRYCLVEQRILHAVEQDFFENGASGGQRRGRSRGRG